jgi:hypothetical protein
MRHPQLDALAEVSGLLDRSGLDHWLFGGWAVDLHVGAVTRDHDDVDLAVWLDDAPAITALLTATGWTHAPEPDEDGGTGYERGGVRLELTFLVPDGDRALLPLRAGTFTFADEPLGDEVRELHGVRVRVLPLARLRVGKATPRDDPGDAAKDAADFAALSQLG